MLSRLNEWRLRSSSGTFHEELPAVDPSRRARLQKLQRDIGVRFHDERLLNLAFCHSSYAVESGSESNERLEFLGDAVLGLVVSQFLYQRLAGLPEGDLARVKSVVVSEEILSQIARRIAIDGYLLLGRGEERSGGRSKSALLADALEALIGACHLDCGLRVAERFIRDIVSSEVESVIAGRHRRDYKTLLQELAQKRFHSFPKYRVTGRHGPDHDQVFVMEVLVDGRSYGPAEGKNKKAAEQRVAQIAYIDLAESDSCSLDSKSGQSAGAS